jgi:hypothetical protein
LDEFHSEYIIQVQEFKDAFALSDDDAK